MYRIASFTVNHLLLDRGIYVSRVDGNVVTYDLRFCKPYHDVVLSNEQMHTLEHLLATIFRNEAEMGKDVVYFGPMGCQTGFYLLMHHANTEENHEKVVKLIIDGLQKVVNWTDEVPGNSMVECGNCTTLNLREAQKAAFSFLSYLDMREGVRGLSEYVQ